MTLLGGGLVLVFDADGRFDPAKVRPLIKEVLNAKLGDQTYSAERCAEWNREICNEVLAKVKGTSLSPE